MYQQYRLINNKYELINISGRPDDINKKILDGFYLTNEQKKLNKNIMTYIFSDWLDGDILVIKDEILKNPILDKGGFLRDKTRKELIIQDNRLDLLYDGEYVDNKTIKIIYPQDNLYKPCWNKVKNIWEESINSQKLFYKDIDTIKAKILENGFIYTDIMQITHQQKCRDKDRSFLESSINTMVDENISSLYWSFNNDDIKNMTIEELKELRKQGFLFNQIVFGVEAKLKAKSPYRLSIEEYKDLIDLESTVKCWR